MIQYHGSYIKIETPDIKHSRKNVDFGKGFYVTPIYDQALKWSLKFKKRGSDGYITSFSFNEKYKNNLNVLEFDSYSESWLDFILKCRAGKDTSSYDLVIGGVANDKVFNTVELFFDGLIDKEEAIKRLRFEKPNLQLCFRTVTSISLLNFIKAEMV